jgi:hypothetical protein
VCGVASRMTLEILQGGRGDSYTAEELAAAKAEERDQWQAATGCATPQEAGAALSYQRRLIAQCNLDIEALCPRYQDSTATERMIRDLGIDGEGLERWLVERGNVASLDDKRMVLDFGERGLVPLRRFTGQGPEELARHLNHLGRVIWRDPASIAREIALGGE